MTVSVMSIVYKPFYPQKEPIKIPKAAPEPIQSPVEVIQSPVEVIQPPVEPIQPVEVAQPPVELIKKPAPLPVQSHIVQQQQQPDVIPTQRESVQPEIIETLPPPEAFSSNDFQQENGSFPAEPEQLQEQIYSNVDYEEQQYANLPNQTVAPNENPTVNSAALVGNEDCDLSELIEDTKIKAIALYDYQASAEDEISFDPNDIITHIEQVTND